MSIWFIYALQTITTIVLANTALILSFLKICCLCVYCFYCAFCNSQTNSLICRISDRLFCMATAPHFCSSVSNFPAMDWISYFNLWVSKYFLFYSHFSHFNIIFISSGVVALPGGLFCCGSFLGCSFVSLNFDLQPHPDRRPSPGLSRPHPLFSVSLSV